MAKGKTSRKPAKAPKPKSGTERTIDSLKERLEADRVSHALAIAAKNQALEEANTNSILFELADSYPHLRELITLLRRAHTAASPLRSSGSGGSRSAEYFSPPERGIFTTADRSRITWIDRKLEGLAAEIEKGMKPRGPLTDELRPQCWNPDCPQAGWHQPFERSIDYGGPGTCVSCGDDFGAHNPYKDKTKDTRCWERGCPEYSHVDKCIHSWQKMGIPA